MSLNIKQNFLFFWGLIDPLYYRCTRLNYVKDNKGKQTIIRVRLTKYKGRTVTLPDGTVIKKNDWLLKIHLHNVKLLKQLKSYDNDIRRALLTYKSVRDSLPYLIKYIESTDYCNKIKGIIGITSLYKGCNKLGFEVYSIQNPYYKWFKKFGFFPIHFLSNSKWWTNPKYLLMSKNILYKKYDTL